MPRILLLNLVTLFLLAVPATAQNAKHSAYLAWQAKAGNQIRLAASYLRTGNTDLAAIALEEIIADKQVNKVRPPMNKVSADTVRAAQSALDLIDANDAPAARKALLKLREMLYQAHKKNNIEIFSDCIWKLVKTGPPLWHYKKNPPDFNKPEQVKAAGQAALDYRRQLAKCDAMASPDLKANDDYKRLVSKALESLQRIPDEALKNKDAGLLYRFIIELRSIDRLLFFRFG